MVRGRNREKLGLLVVVVVVAAPLAPARNLCREVRGLKRDRVRVEVVEDGLDWGCLASLRLESVALIDFCLLEVPDVLLSFATSSTGLGLQRLLVVQ